MESRACIDASAGGDVGNAIPTRPVHFKVVNDGDADARRIRPREEFVEGEAGESGVAEYAGGFDARAEGVGGLGSRAWRADDGEEGEEEGSGANWHPRMWCEHSAWASWESQWCGRLGRLRG